MFGQISQIRMLENCRIVSGAKKYDHVTPLLKSLSWLPVKDQLYYHQAIMAFKCMTVQARDYLRSQFINCEEVSKRTTRRRQKQQFIPMSLLICLIGSMVLLKGDLLLHN